MNGIKCTVAPQSAAQRSTVELQPEESQLEGSLVRASPAALVASRRGGLLVADSNLFSQDPAAARLTGQVDLCFATLLL